MADFGLGGFAGRLSADELRAALAAAGGNPDALDLTEPALQGAPQPAVEPPPPMPETAPAPQPEPEPAPVEEPKPDMSVKRARGGPAKAIDTYQQENLEDANRRIEIAGESGDKTGQDAASYDAQAEISGRQAKQAQANIDDARTRVDARREHEERYHVEADRIYEQMRANAQPPPQSTLNKVLGIVGAVAGMGGRGNVGQGLSMLTSMLGSDQERWAAEQQANSRLYQAALSSVGSDREGASHDVALAQALTALEAHEIDAALEQVKSMGLSRNATRAAEDLQLGMRSEVRNGLIGMEREKAKSAAARGASMQEDALWRMPLESLRELAAGGGSELASKVLGKREEVEAKTQKNTGGGEGGVQTGVGGGAAVDGLQLKKQPRDVTAKDYEQAKEIRDGYVTLQHALDNMAKLQGDATYQAKGLYDDAFTMAVGGLNQMAAAGVVNPGELKAWQDRLPKHIIDNVTGGNSKAVFVDEEKQLKSLRDHLKELAADKLKSRGYAFEPDPTPEEKYADLGAVRPGPGSGGSPSAASGATSSGGPGAPPGDIRETLRTAQDYFDRRRGLGSGPGGF